MKNFTYVAKDSSGKNVKGTMEAEDAQDLLGKVHDQGLYLISYNEALGGKRKNSYRFSTKKVAINYLNYHKNYYKN